MQVLFVDQGHKSGTNRQLRIELQILSGKTQPNCHHIVAKLEEFIENFLSCPLSNYEKRTFHIIKIYSTNCTRIIRNAVLIVIRPQINVIKTIYSNTSENPFIALIILLKEMIWNSISESLKTTTTEATMATMLCIAPQQQQKQQFMNLYSYFISIGYIKYWQDKTPTRLGITKMDPTQL